MSAVGRKLKDEPILEMIMEKLEAFYLLVTALTAVAAVTPTDKDDKVIGRLKNLLDKVKKVLMKF